MPPAYVKPYVKRQKNGATDAEAICEAVSRANMRVVPTKTPEKQSGLGLHRTRHLFIRQQTSVINAIRAMITAWHRCCETSRRLDEIPGVGPALATALVASVANPRAFRSGRDFSAWMGLLPKRSSSGGKLKLGSISKQGDRWLCTRRDPLRQDPWHRAPTMAHRIASTAADEGGHHRTRQQDRQNGLGHDGQG
jgi:transposase